MKKQISPLLAANLTILLAIAVLVIYIVLGILYESFIHPITILSGLPSAVFGALLKTAYWTAGSDSRNMPRPCVAATRLREEEW